VFTGVQTIKSTLYWVEQQESEEPPEQTYLPENLKQIQGPTDPYFSHYLPIEQQIKFVSPNELVFVHAKRLNKK